MHIMLMSEAKKLQGKLQKTRHYLHSHPGAGFDIADTCHYVENTLISLGLSPHTYGKAGIVASIGPTNGKTILLRADMDALPITEVPDTDIPFASTNGYMHACGHDLHTTMLLGAVELLKKYEKELPGQVIFCFQPAEEILEGAKDMIDAGILRDTKPDAAIMMHVTLGMPFPTGTVILCDGGISAPAADYFSLKIQGKGCHGAMPQLGVDPITVAAHILTALPVLHARELSMFADSALTFGTIHAGDAANVIPDTATLSGTLRAYDESTRSFLKSRFCHIVSTTADCFRATAEVVYTSGCPTLKNDSSLSEEMTFHMKKLLGNAGAFTQNELKQLAANQPKSSSDTLRAIGSEDFAYFSHEVPSLMLAIAAGNDSTGCAYPLHHPKVRFDEEVLWVGAAAYAYGAYAWLTEHCSTEA